MPEVIEEDGVLKLINAEDKLNLEVYRDSEELLKDIEQGRANLIKKYAIKQADDEAKATEIYKTLQTILSHWSGDVEEEFRSTPDDNNIEKGALSSFNRQLEKLKKQAENEHNALQEEIKLSTQKITTVDLDISKPENVQALKDLCTQVITAVYSLRNTRKETYSLVDRLRKYVHTAQPVSEKLKNYKQLVAAPQEKIHDLILGRGLYSGKNVDERLDLFNRWAASTSQRIITGMVTKKEDATIFRYAHGIHPGFTFNDCKFNQMEIEGTHMDSTNFVNCEFNECVMKRTGFRESMFDRCIFNWGSISYADLYYAIFKRTKFENVTIKGCYLTHNRIDGEVSFVECIFDDINLGGFIYEYDSKIVFKKGKIIKCHLFDDTKYIQFVDTKLENPAIMEGAVSKSLLSCSGVTKEDFKSSIKIIKANSEFLNAYNKLPSK